MMTLGARMRRGCLGAIVAVWLGGPAGCGGPAGPATAPAPPAASARPPVPAPEEKEAPANGRLPFRVPAGYIAERVAGPPLIRHPMFAAFDPDGHLYVAGSSGQDLTAEQRRASPPDVIRRLEDSDGDGTFDRQAVFADRLTYPQGILWHDGAIYTASPPGLWRLEDTDGDGKADRRSELVTGFPFTGIADDLHGPCLGPDGRIYWGVGRFPYAIRRPDGPLIRKGEAPLIMRCRPDGEDVEVFCTAMGNPVELAFSPEGEPFACGTFLSPESQGEGLRDAIIHCIQGGVYAVRDRMLLEDKRTGDVLPPLSHLGVAAGSGMMRARGPSFGDGRIHLFSALYNMHSVAHHVVERDGATFRAQVVPFVESDDPDFHPTDVLEDADGSFLVVDTGAWFVHCPTSQIGRTNAFGGIYRVRKADDRPPADPRGRELDWRRAAPATLAGRLDDPRFAVRDRAVERLARRGARAVPALREVLRRGNSAEARLNAVWALARIDDDSARAAVRDALGDEAMGVRLAAANVAGLRRDREALGPLTRLAESGEPAVRRQAATALGRLRRDEAVPALLLGLRDHPDRFLEHALIFALIQLADREATLKGLADPDPQVRRGALIALDQMEDGGLTPAIVARLLDPAEPELEQAAVRILASRPAWAGAIEPTLRRALARPLGPGPAADRLREQLVAFSRDSAIQGLMAEALGRPSTPATTRALVLEVMARAPVEPFPAPWADALGRALEDGDEGVVRRAVAAIRARDLKGFASPLHRLAADARRDAELRVEALDAASAEPLRLDPPLFDFLAATLGLDAPPLLRLNAARVLGRSRLADPQRIALAGRLDQAGAAVLPRLLPAFEGSADRRVGLALVAALERAPALRGLDGDALRRALAAYPPEVARRAAPLLAKLEAGEQERASRLVELEPLVGRGDPLRGREVFFGRRATCSTCHTVQGDGGKVGPNLSKIGAIRTGRDLLEAIVYPSASFARGFEPFVVSTEDGRVHSGIIARESAESITLVVPGSPQLTLPRSSIDLIEPARTSIMPQGLDANLSRQELGDLVAFLSSLR